MLAIWTHDACQNEVGENVAWVFGQMEGIINAAHGSSDGTWRGGNHSRERKLKTQTKNSNRLESSCSLVCGFVSVEKKAAADVAAAASNGGFR
jgi:hypothetical protein